MVGQFHSMTVIRVVRCSSASYLRSRWSGEDICVHGNEVIVR